MHFLNFFISKKEVNDSSFGGKVVSFEVLFDREELLIEMKFVDVKRMNCARSLILLKRVARDVEDGEALRIECDNPETYERIINYFRDCFVTIKEEKKEDVFLLEVISKRPKKLNKQDESLSLGRNVPDSRSACIIVVNHCSSDPDEGQKERAFILDVLRSFRENQIFPKRFIFCNSGVRQLNDSVLKAEIRSFEACGSDILISRTCAKLFKIENDIKQELLIGTEEIVYSLTGSEKVIYL